jgi:hypothetical protein
MLFRLFSVAMLSSCFVFTTQAASIFPTVIETGSTRTDGSYDENVDLLSIQSRGVFEQDLAGGIFVKPNDTVLGLYSVLQIDGLAPVGGNLALVVSFDFTGANVAAAADGIGASNRVGYRVQDALATSLAAQSYTSGAAASVALISSASTDFSSIAGTDLDTAAEFTATLAAVGDLYTEALFSFTNNGPSGGLLNTFAATLGLTDIENQIGTPTSWIPSVLDTTAPGQLPGSFDLVLGSGAFVNPSGPSLGVGTLTGGIGALTGGAEGAMNPVPEPGSIFAMLACAGVAGMVERRRRRNRK